MNNYNLTEEQLEKLGHDFAQLFNCKYHKKTNRYGLAHGEYSPIGVGRWVLRQLNDSTVSQS